jgi:hypothetical protein
MATTDTLRAALTAELSELCPLASNPVENADLAIDIDAYCKAREAELLLTANHLSNRSQAGQTFGYRDAASAQRMAQTMAAKLTRAGFSLNVGATTLADMRGLREQNEIQ